MYPLIAKCNRCGETFTTRDGLFFCENDRNAVNRFAEAENYQLVVQNAEKLIAEAKLIIGRLEGAAGHGKVD